jgi:hypothetical protein
MARHVRMTVSQTADAIFLPADQARRNVCPY